MRLRTLALLLLLPHTYRVEAQVPGAVTRVPLNGIELAYRTVGTGEPLLLLHGFFGCGDDWAPFIERLSAEYRLLIVDLRGHGGSTNAPGPFLHRQAGDDVVALLDHLGIPKIRAMGISSGAMALLHAASRKPERFDALVLIGGTTHFPEPARRLMQMVGRQRPPPGDRDTRCATRGEPQFRALQGQFAAFQSDTTDMRFTPSTLGAITARTLIVHGDRDELFPVEIPVAMYHGIRDSQLWIVPRGDHVPIYGRSTGPFLDAALLFLETPAPR
jgi:pimeloyl-ACP methyl ester carboxylesterase